MKCWQNDHMGNGHTVEPYEVFQRDQLQKKWSELKSKVVFFLFSMSITKYFTANPKYVDLRVELKTFI